MTRSGREALASALKGDEQNLYKGFEEWADRILSCLRRGRMGGGAKKATEANI